MTVQTGRGEKTTESKWGVRIEEEETVHNPWMLAFSSSAVASASSGAVCDGGWSAGSPFAKWS